MHRGASVLGTDRAGRAQDEVFGCFDLLEAAVAADSADAERPSAEALPEARTGRIGEHGKQKSHLV